MPVRRDGGSRARVASERALGMALQACLNGSRRPDEHPSCPITPAELARDAALAVAAGAVTLHVHPRDALGNESLDPADVGAALSAIRETVTVPVGVSSGAWIMPDLDARLRAIDSWELRPDFASVNFHEPGALEVAELMLDRGVGVEAGLWHEEAAQRFADSGLADRCLRILLEPMEETVEVALQNVERIERVLTGVAAGIPRLLHGSERTVWPVFDAAAARDFDVRIGLEDTLARADGLRAHDNESLVRTAVDRAAGHCQEAPPGLPPTFVRETRPASLPCGPTTRSTPPGR